MNFLLKGCCLENLAACAARVGTMLCRYIVGKNMVILYSVTQPPATRDNNEQHFRRTASWTLQNLILMVGFSLIAYFFNAHAHLLFRLLSRNYLVRSLGSLMSLIVHRITLFTIYCIIQFTMILFIILNATLKFSQHLLWKCGWKPRYALIFPSAARALLRISFWVSNSQFSGEIPTIWSVHMLMVSLSNVCCHRRTSSRKPMPTVKLSPGFVGHPLLFLNLTLASKSIVSLPKKSPLGYSTQTTCIACIYPSYPLLSLHLPPSLALEIPKIYLVTKHLLFQKLSITSRTKALFELKLLRDNDSLYPPEAQEVSAATWMLLSMLREEVEDKRNMGMF